VAASLEVVSRLAREHLTPPVAEKWISLLRPAARLKHAGPGEAIVGELGGDPWLHEDVDWPVWGGHGPLTHVGSVDCQALKGITLDIALPGDGRLAFFYFDGQLDGGQAIVFYEQPDSLAGSRVLYVPAGANATRRRTPKGLTPYPRVALSAEPIVTYPGFDHPALRRAFDAESLEPRAFDHPVNADAFTDALSELDAGPFHQVGGYADPIQGPIEYEVAQAALGGKVDWRDPALEREASQWSLLAQIDTDDDANMMWGDAGMLYWAIRPADLDKHRLDAASFTWQCS
jgi:hypothetical protein